MLNCGKCPSTAFDVAVSANDWLEFWFAAPRVEEVDAFLWLALLSKARCGPYEVSLNK